MNPCRECGGYMAKTSAYYVCMKCGLVGSEVFFVNEYDPNAWMKKKSQHKRNKWFAKRLFSVVNYGSVNTLVYDFMRVVNLLADRCLIKRNVSKYGYYIIRLSSRRGIPLLTHVNDIKKGKIKKVFDDNLFGPLTASALSI